MDSDDIILSNADFYLRISACLPDGCNSAPARYNLNLSIVVISIIIIIFPP